MEWPLSRTKVYLLNAFCVLHALHIVSFNLCNNYGYYYIIWYYHYSLWQIIKMILMEVQWFSRNDQVNKLGKYDRLQNSCSSYFHMLLILSASLELCVQTGGRGRLLFTSEGQRWMKKIIILWDLLNSLGYKEMYIYLSWGIFLKKQIHKEWILNAIFYFPTKSVQVLPRDLRHLLKSKKHSARETKGKSMLGCLTRYPRSNFVKT